MNRRVLHCLGVCLVAAAIPLAAQTSFNLTVTSATSSSVSFSWQAVSGGAGYQVESRVMSDGGSSFYSAYLADSNTTATVQVADPSATYEYIVTGVVGLGSARTVVSSNAVIVGPPPVGFSVVAPTPAAVSAAGYTSKYGRHISMALDANGDPAFAFADESNVGHAASENTDIYFVGWDRARYQWRTPVKVDTVYGQVGNDTIALAFDSSTNVFGVAYTDQGINNHFNSYVHYATSIDDGGSWVTTNGFVSSNNAISSGTSMKMANGQVYLMASDTNGIYYITGLERATGSWKQTLIPNSNIGVHGVGPGLYDVALDSNAQPGVVWEGGIDNPEVVYYWRPGMAASTTVMGAQNPDTGQDLRMVYAGLNPRIVTNVPVATTTAQYPANLFVISTNDGGNTWAAVQLPSDGNRNLIAPFTLAVGPQGQAAVSATDNGGNSTGVLCGEPKLIRSTDLKTWAVCNPGNSVAPALGADFVNAVFGANGKLLLAFQHYADLYFKGEELPGGVILWRESPTASGLPAPVINVGGVINNAGETPGQALAPGSIAEVYGTNLGSLATAQSLPLLTALGQPNSGASPVIATTVFINAARAPIFFTSAGQVDIQIPFETTALPNTINGSFPANSDIIQVEVNDSLSAPISFLHGSTGPGLSVAVNPDGTNQPSSAVSAGSYLTVYGSGFGVTSNQPADGAASPGGTNLANVSAMVTATIGGQNAPVEFAGLAPNFVGLCQINVQVPSGLTTGTYPLVINAGGAASANKLTISVK